MEEGYFTDKPPLLKGVKYDYQKEWMIAHLESIHIDMWDVVENGNHIPYDNELNEIPRSQWTEVWWLQRIDEGVVVVQV